MESANVVGYSAANTRVGFAAVSTSFEAVSGSIDLQDLTVTGYNHEDGFEGDVYLETLTSLGAADQIYTWVDVPADPEDPESVAFYGWYDGSDALVEGVTINPGDGFWVHSDSTAYGIQNAGAVITTSTAITLKNGFTLVGNPVPVSVSIQELSISGYDHDAGFEGDIYAETLTSTGAADEIYTWVDVPADPEDPESVAFYGWYDGSDALVVASVGAGEALWIHSDSTSYSVVFPGVDL